MATERFLFANIPPPSARTPPPPPSPPRAASEQTWQQREQGYESEGGVARPRPPGHGSGGLRPTVARQEAQLGGAAVLLVVLGCLVLARVVGVPGPQYPRGVVLRRKRGKAENEQGMGRMTG